MKAVLVDGSTWDYGYNDRGEVTSAARKNAAGTTIPALGATYGYDGIGNRTSSTSPVLGDRTYVANALNQYQSITTAPTRTVVGRAPVADAVSVNGTTLGPAHRTGEVFHFALPAAANANSPVWQAATVVSQGNTIARAFYHPKAVTAPQHDPDGNLVNDGRWVYLWDAENRLIQMESTVAAVQAGAPYRKLVFRYDAGGRRLARTVYHGTAAAPVFHSSTRWLYDGWNPISEFSGTADTGGTITRTKSYTWGLDLSGSPQGAGGVGGLLAVVVHSGFTNSVYYPSYDGNGNIVAWTLEGTPAPVSRREYDAFGNTLVEQGVAPSAYGLSTKMQDAETGLYYYGYRYYDPVMGRWPSRDPIEETGGLNLHASVQNNFVNKIDYLGQKSYFGNWAKYYSPYLDELGFPLSRNDILNMLWSEGKVVNHPHPQIKRGGVFVTFGGLTEDALLVTSVSIYERYDNCWTHDIFSEHIVFAVTISTSINKTTGYWSRMAHELDHVRALAVRGKNVITPYLLIDRPEYTTESDAMIGAKYWGEKIQRELALEESKEAAHSDDNLYTPGEREFPNWTPGDPDWDGINRPPGPGIPVNPFFDLIDLPFDIAWWVVEQLE